MKTFRLIYLAIVTCLLSACQAEIWEPYNPEISPDQLGTNLSVSSIPLAARNTGYTKASYNSYQEVLSKVDDINIKITLSNTASVKGPIFIFYNGTQKEVSGLTDKDVTVLNRSLSNFQCHFETLKSKDIAKIEAIANAGKNLKNENWATFKEDESMNLLKQDKCMMYGVCVTDPNQPGNTAPGTNSHDGKTCDNYELKLKRTRAMVSVKMINDGMAEGLSIEPREIRFRHMPKSCTLTDLDTLKGNRIKLATDTAAIASKVLSEGILSNIDKHAIGHHDEHTPLRTEYFFFPFENMQGTTTNPTGTDRDKFPAGVNKENADDMDINFKATYLEIVGQYMWRDKNSNNAVAISGTIIYRFFLGNDPQTNFDILGNTYYRVNLHLKNFAGASEDGKFDGNTVVANGADASWRVDLDILDWGFEQNQFDFDGHYIDGKVKVVGDGWSFVSVTDGDGKKDDGSASWFTMKILDPYHTGEWVNPTNISSSAQLNIENGHMSFAVQPMLYAPGSTDRIKRDPDVLQVQGYYDERTYKLPKNYREMIIKVKKDGTNPAEYQEVHIRQYVPIPVFSDPDTEKNLVGFMERFEEYPSDPKTGSKLVGYPWMWNTETFSGKFKNPTNGEFSYSFTLGDAVDSKKAAENTVILSHKYTSWGEELDPKAIGCAADVCYQKSSQGGVQQGAAVSAYILPSKKMLEYMFEKSKRYEQSWGPFELLHVYEDYWTQSVISGTNSVYYNGNTHDYPNDGNRDLKKRVRALFVDETGYAPFMKPSLSNQDW